MTKPDRTPLKSNAGMWTKGMRMAHIRIEFYPCVAYFILTHMQTATERST